MGARIVGKSQLDFILSKYFVEKVWLYKSGMQAVFFHYFSLVFLLWLLLL